MNGPEVVLYGRPGYHLCDEARTVLERVGADRGFVLRAVNIEDDPVLHRRYLERIPVVALDGEELYDFFVDEHDLCARLAARGGPDVATKGDPPTPPTTAPWPTPGPVDRVDRR